MARICHVLAAVVLFLTACSVSSSVEPATTPAPLEVVAEGAEPTSLPVGDASGCDEVLPTMQSGLPTYDYEPAGSYWLVSERSMVMVRGRVDAMVRTNVNGQTFTELHVSDVVDVRSGLTPELSVVAFGSDWADTSNVDPLKELVPLTNVEFLGFVSPWSGVRGGWSPGIEGLYITCRSGGRIEAVIADGGGAGDPSGTTIDEITAIIAAEQAMRDAVGMPTSVPALPPEFAAGLTDSLLRFAQGDDAAFNAIPFADQVALGLGSEIDRVVDRDDLSVRGSWEIDRPEGYAQFAGPFSAIETLNRGLQTQTTVGPHDHCAGPPLPNPSGFEDYYQVSLQPADGEVDSCIPWFAVELFVDPTSLQIGAITLALFGP